MANANVPLVKQVNLYQNEAVDGKGSLGHPVWAILGPVQLVTAFWVNTVVPQTGMAFEGTVPGSEQGVAMMFSWRGAFWAITKQGKKRSSVMHFLIQRTLTYSISIFIFHVDPLRPLI
jgi:hypothetical protein